MRALFLLLLAPLAGCVAVDVDVDEVCNESTLALAAPAFAGEVDVDLGIADSTVLRDARTTLELDLASVEAIAVTVDGVDQRLPITDAARTAGRIETPAAVQQPKFKVRYQVVTKPGVRTLSLRARTCAASSTHIEKRVL